MVCGLPHRSIEGSSWLTTPIGYPLEESLARPKWYAADLQIRLWESAGGAFALDEAATHPKGTGNLIQTIGQTLNDAFEHLGDLMDPRGQQFAYGPRGGLRAGGWCHSATPSRDRPTGVTRHPRRDI
jgi:hypothetical protein